MGICCKSVACCFSDIGSCCKRPATPHSPDRVPSASREDPPPGDSTDVPPPITPQELPKITGLDQLNRFIEYIEGLLAALQKKPPNQSAASTSKAGQEFSDHVKFAAGTMEKISSEAEKFKDSTGDLASKLPEEARRIVTHSLKGLGNLHWIGVAFSIVAFVLENIHQVSSNQQECIQVLEKIVDLAKILQQLSETMSPAQTDERLKKAVHKIVEVAIICCHYMQGRSLFRYLTAQTVGQSLKDAGANLHALTSELNLLVTADIHAQQARRLEPSQNILQIREPVGMSEPFQKVKDLLDMKNSQVAKAVIIYGFGGSGKTTLAEYVVSNLPLNDFKLCVIRIDERKLDIKKLQEQILSDAGGQKIDLRDSIEGKSMLRDALKDRLCFFVIDNITDKNQIKDLLPQDLCLSPGSRMLITSRNSDVKEVLPRNIQWEEYLVEVLPKEKAVELLHKIVFKNRQHVTSDDERRVGDIAEACRGVPLLLTVYGGYLSVHWSESAYKEALDSLTEVGERGPFKEEELSNRLLHVYHRMRNQDAKEAFLDICTFFHGCQKREVSTIVGEYELQSLQDGALVKITESDEVIVHDVLRLMGIKEGRGTRLQSTDDLCALLDDDEDEEKLQALRKVKGICLDGKFDLDSKHLNKMSNSLRVLKLGDGMVLEGQCEGRKFKNLRALFVVRNSCDTFPFKDFCGLRSLKLLIIGQYRSLTELPRGFGQLTSLTELWIIDCATLNSLPADFGELRSLKWLVIRECPSLTELPRGFGQLTSLIDLQIRDCKTLKSLPADFGGLRSLKELLIQQCPSLTELPRGFGQLTSLTKLKIMDCATLNSLPADFGELRSLKLLLIDDCPSLTELPRGFGQLASLTELSLSCCKQLERVSSDFECLTCLKILTMCLCPILEAATMEKVVKLKNLSEVNIWGSENLEERWRETQNKEVYSFLMVE